MFGGFDAIGHVLLGKRVNKKKNKIGKNAATHEVSIALATTNKQQQQTTNKRINITQCH